MDEQQYLYRELGQLYVQARRLSDSNEQKDSIIQRLEEENKELKNKLRVAENTTIE